MKVSVVVLAYNSEEFLSRTLDSIINQVYKNIEIIVIEAGGLDSTKQIIKKYAEKDDRIIPFYQGENKGVSAARNIGLKAVTGDYVIFVDSADEITKDAIRRMVDVSQRYNSDYVDSYHLLKYTKDNMKEVSFTEYKIPKKTLVLGSINDDIRVLNMYNCITGKLIKKELLDDLNFDESLSGYEDLVFENQIKTRIKNYTFINKTLYIYYQTKESLVNNFDKNNLCYLDAVKIIKELYSNYSIEIINTINSMLFKNMIKILFTMVIKNEDSNEENTFLVKEYLDELIELFPDYMENPKLNYFIKKKISKFLINNKKLYKFVKKMRKKDFIKLHFKFLSIFRKYEIKNPLNANF